MNNFTSFETFGTGIFQKKTSFSSDGSTFPPRFSNQKNPTLWEKLGRGPGSDQGICWEDQPPKKNPFGYHSRTLLQNPPTQQSLPSAGSWQKGWVRLHGSRGFLRKFWVGDWNRSSATHGRSGVLRKHWMGEWNRWEMNWWETKKLCYHFQKLSCTTLCTARQQQSTTRQRSSQRTSGQSAAKVQPSLSTALQTAGSQSSSAQVLNRGRPEPDSSSSDSVTSNW